MALEILSTTSDLNEYGGAQKVLLDLHNGIKTRYKCKILGFKKFEDLHPKYKIADSEYVRFANPFYLNNKILIVHARNVMAFMWIFKKVFFLNTRILYVAHNVYGTHKNFSFFPHRIISISKKVTDNLVNYFNLKNRDITLIYNGIKDDAPTEAPVQYKQSGKVKIVYSARVIDVKRQLLIVDHLKGKLHPDVEIYFAGHGPDYEKLLEKCSETPNFKALGFVEDVNGLVKSSDFLMLFSIQEGLPISLIEGTMFSKPILVNDVGGNLEIGVPGQNGIELKEDWDALAVTLNGLATLSEDEYAQMCTKSRKHFEKMFSYDRMVAEYIKVIDSMQSMVG